MLFDPVDEIIIAALRRCRRPTTAPKLLGWLGIVMSERQLRRYLQRMEQRGTIKRPSGWKKGYVVA